MKDDGHRWTFNNERINFLNRAHDFARDTGNWTAFGLAHTIVFRRMDAVTRTAIVSRPQLAADMGISEDTVQRLLRGLEPLGLLVKRGNGRGNAGHYSIGQPTMEKGGTHASLPDIKGGARSPLSAPERGAHSPEKGCIHAPPSNKSLELRKKELALAGESPAREGNFSKAKKAGIGRRISQSWAPTEDDRAFAASKGLTVGETDFQSAKFLAHYLAAPDHKGGLSASWSARFHKWVLGTIERKGNGAATPNGGNGTAPADASKFTATQWKSRLAIHAERGGDWPAEWGPAPGTPGCLVPADLLVKPVAMPPPHASRSAGISGKAGAA